MKTQFLRKILLMVSLGVFLTPFHLKAADQRTIPLDMYLIIDTSEGFRDTQSETINWINDQVIDRLLQEGDRLMIWSAGPAAQVIYTETIGAKKDDAKAKLLNLTISGRNADFSGALRDAASRAAKDNPDRKRISYTMLVSGSAENLAPALGGSGNLFRWSRAEKYDRWQILVADPNIAQRVSRAAASYMGTR
ncbi:MAG: hypothetical protein FWD78_12405 [Treponema sp.]|nr:hypothetical protein [Treponema sp.]